MFECWTADRVWISFLFLTTWKWSHLIKTKFIENEKRVLKKETSKKKSKEEKRETCPRRDLNLRLWTRKTKKNTELTLSTTPASAEKYSVIMVYHLRQKANL